MPRTKKTTEPHEDRNKTVEQPLPAVADTGVPPQAEAAPEPVIDAAALIGEIETLKKDLEESRLKASEYLDGWQRSVAEFANYKKRVDRDQGQQYLLTTGNVVKRFLEVVDDMERAMKTRPQNGEEAVWADGIELIQRKLATILEAEGVKTIDVDGKFFDPNFHEAISQEDSPSHQSGQIIGVVKQGYILGDRVLRPALVRVAR